MLKATIFEQHVCYTLENITQYYIAIIFDMLSIVKSVPDIIRIKTTGMSFP